MLPGATDFEAVELPSDIEGAVDAYKETSGLGYVVTASAQGYDGPINLMVGFDAEGTITGVKMLEHSETPGFGAKLAEDSYGAGYVGKTASDYTEVTAFPVRRSLLQRIKKHWARHLSCTVQRPAIPWIFLKW